MTCSRDKFNIELDLVFYAIYRWIWKYVKFWKFSMRTEGSCEKVKFAKNWHAWPPFFFSFLCVPKMSQAKKTKGPEPRTAISAYDFRLFSNADDFKEITNKWKHNILSFENMQSLDIPDMSSGDIEPKIKLDFPFPVFSCKIMRFNRELRIGPDLQPKK